ncbi:MAG: tRNA threonylcarbamoyladenosine dehydratase [Defluviitaleaceae bacterium]|nr:tRNA threonylcarbamoyladenosine dehydratase [Defluviitaleaceae bacterium]
MDQFSRTQMLFGKEGMKRLFCSHVAVFGVGGVGGFAIEGLARSGVGKISIFDDDNICLTNINRQIMATSQNVGNNKVDEMKLRVMSINPKATVNAHLCFYDKDTHVDLTQYDYIIDAVDTVSSKLLLVERAKDCAVPIISCMGTGNKLDPTRFLVADIFETKICPLAKVMRKELRRRGIKELKVVYSQELPMEPDDNQGELSCKRNCICPQGAAAHCTFRRQVPGSVSFVPSVAGMILAGEVIKQILDKL